MASEILNDIYNGIVGLTHSGRLLAKKGLVVGGSGGEAVSGQMVLRSPTDFGFFDDFEKLDTSRWRATEGTDSVTSNAAILAGGAGGLGGVLRLTTGDAGTGLAADTEQLTHTTLQFKAANGNLVFEIRVKLSAITNCWAFFGFTDTVAAALEAPIMSAGSGNTLTSNAADAVGFMFDTRMTDGNWWLVGVKADTDATAQNSGYAPVADTYEVLRIEVDTSGNAMFFRNGLKIGSRMSNALTASVALTPIMAVSKTSVAASMTCDIDYVHASCARA